MANIFGHERICPLCREVISARDLLGNSGEIAYALHITCKSTATYACLIYETQIVLGIDNSTPSSYKPRSDFWTRSIQ